MHAYFHRHGGRSDVRPFFTSPVRVFQRSGVLPFFPSDARAMLPSPVRPLFRSRVLPLLRTPVVYIVRSGVGACVRSPLSQRIPPSFTSSSVRAVFSSPVVSFARSPVRFARRLVKSPNFLGTRAPFARSLVRTFATRNVTPPSFNCPPKQRIALTAFFRLRTVAA